MATTKVIMGTDGNAHYAVFTQIQNINTDTFLCFSDSEGFSECSKDWIKGEIKSPLQSRDTMFLLGMLFQAGFKNVEIESFGGFISKL